MILWAYYYSASLSNIHVKKNSRCIGNGKYLTEIFMKIGNVYNHSWKYEMFHETWKWGMFIIIHENIKCFMKMGNVYNHSWKYEMFHENGKCL